MAEHLQKRTIVHAVILLLLLSGCKSVFAQNLDIDWLRSINLNRNRSLDKPMKGITNSVYLVSCLLPAAQLADGYFGHHPETFTDGLGSAGSMAIDVVLTEGFKYAANRQRPYVKYTYLQPYERFNDPSFPSGHTSIAFTVATDIALTYHKWYFTVPAYLYAGLAGYSRLHLGVHYPSDVLAGALIGTGSAWLGYKGQKWLLHHKKTTIQKYIGH